MAEQFGIAISIPIANAAGQWPIVAACVVGLAGSGCFLLAKALLWQRAARLWGCRFSLRDSLRLFVEGVVVQALTWPGRLWGDIYRIGLIRPLRRPEPCLATAASFRAATMLGQALTLLIAFSLLFWSWSLMFVAGVFAVAAWSQLFGRRQLPRTWQGLMLAFAGTLAPCADAAAFGALSWMLCGAEPVGAAASYTIISVVAAFSGLPLGIGVLDIGCVAVLAGGYGAAPAAAFQAVLIHRASGPGLTLGLGAISLMIRWRANLAALASSNLRRCQAAWTRLRTAVVDAGVPAAEWLGGVRRHQGLRRAFTLVELVVVVLVLGIIAAIAAPKIFGVTDQAYLGSAKRLENDLANAVSLYLSVTQRMPKQFFSWVAADADGSQLNLVRLAPYRHSLADPGATVVDNDTITMIFANGLTAEYRIDASGNIEATYAGPGVD